MHFGFQEGLGCLGESGLRVDRAGGLRSPRDSRVRRGALSTITPMPCLFRGSAGVGPLVFGHCVESRS